jgi:DNA polymerase V
MSLMFQPTLNTTSARIDLYNLVTTNPDATFFLKYIGCDEVDFGIYTNDILVIDRSLNPKLNTLVVGYLDGEFKLKKLEKGVDFEVWGVVKYVIHKV